MIEKKDFDTIRKAFLIYDTNFNNHMFTYTYQHRKTKKLLEMNVQFEAGNFMHLCGVDYYQIEPDAYRIIGIATMNPGFMAPAVRTMYNHILKQYKNIY